LSHELKHVIDANRDKITYQGISERGREQIADYFAACYLMPKTMVRRAWTGGLRDPEALAGLFKVSVQAMDKRLKYLQYIDDQPQRPVASYFRHQKQSFRGRGGSDQSDGQSDHAKAA
jgi:Zn-dependent peptidase ImmA (M78 family)